MDVVDVSESNFQTEVLDRSHTVPVVVDFWAEWCGPCRQLTPVLERAVAARSGKIELAKVDVDANPITAGRFGVRSIPTLILFKNGRETQRLVGYMPKEKLLSLINPHLGTANTSAA